VGDRGIVIRYEDFVRDPETHTANLCGYLGIEKQPTMVDYSGTPVPKGSMNDPVGVHRHSRPQSDSADSWKKLAETPQDRHFAHSLLDAIGPETLTLLGYDPDALRDAMGEPPDPSTPGIYPWVLSIKPKEHWRLPERLRHESYKASQRYPGNPPVAWLSARHRTLQYVIRQVRFVLGWSSVRY
jgi:hypothetical protein